MFAVFSINGLSYLHYNIVDVDLSMYDEIMLSTLASNEFSVTFSLDPFDSPTDDFSVFWRNNTINKKNIELLLFNSENQLLARGFVFEWKENRSEAQIEFKCKTDIATFLDHNMSWNITKVIGYNYNDSLTQMIENIWVEWFNWLWGCAMGGKTYVFEGTHRQFFYHIAETIRALHYANYSYSIKFVHGLYYSRKHFLKQIAMILNSKIVYDIGNDRFIITPFKQYSETPIEVTGYITDKGYDTKEQSVDDIDLFTSLKILNVNGSDVTNQWDPRPLNRIISAVQNQLDDIVEYETFKIWGYASQIINTGQTIKLNGTDYYVKDISYEFERLNDIKSFNCEAVRFIE
ncbi:MAG TPA: hypothetical protein PKJ08_08425 [Candidatus Cloacimonadota bacterium]|nr:hypothetical protein [Candidatus Cloacimonadota bacterium]